MKLTSSRRPGQEGMVLFIVLMLVLMFTGLGIMAMRHTREELRSTGAYFDNRQAAAMAEGALAMVATDIKESSDFYRMAFSNPDYEVTGTDGGTGTDYIIPINPETGHRSISDGHPILFDSVTDGYCLTNDGTVRGCVHQLSYPLSGDTNLEVDNAWARTLIRHGAPRIGPCPPGFSCDDEQNYGWYIFDVESEAIYGANSAGGTAENPQTSMNYSYGRASAQAIMTVGPIGIFGR